jgi:hypothetical protein
LLDAEQRSERARNAALARHHKPPEDLLTEFDWSTEPYERCLRRLAALRTEYDAAARILTSRPESKADANLSCAHCHKSITPGKWAMQRTVKSKETGLYVTVFYCSERCIRIGVYNDAGLPR